MYFSRKMTQFAESVFSNLLVIKREREQKGAPLIDLSIGTPNIPPAKHILEALCSAAAVPQNYIYAINDQVALQEAVSFWYEKRYGVTLDPQSEVCSLLGSQEGFFHLAVALLNEGDRVLVPDPCYPIFADGPRLAGAQLYYMPQKRENGYVLQLEDIPEEIAKEARLLIVSYPNNPTTALASPTFYRDLIDFARQYEIIVLHDNAYSELVFDGQQCASFLSYPGAKEVGVEFNSLSKTYGLAGARIGFCVGQAAIVSQLKILKSNIDYGLFLPLQKAAIAAITGDQACVAVTRKAYQTRRDLLCTGLNEIGWAVEKPRATMFVWAPLPFPYQNSLEFAADLVEKAGVLVTPGSAFGPSGEGHVRMALVQDEVALKEAIRAIGASGLIDKKKQSVKI